jgi:hypothetical protein
MFTLQSNLYSMVTSKTKENNRTRQVTVSKPISKVWPYIKSLIRNELYLILLVQWNLSNPKHQGTRDMYRIVPGIGILGFHF